MREYKIDRSNQKEELKDSEIYKYKDFGKLTTNYQKVIKRLHKKPLYKDPRAFIALILILVVLWLVIEAANEASPEDMQAPAGIEKVLE